MFLQADINRCYIFHKLCLKFNFVLFFGTITTMTLWLFPTAGIEEDRIAQ